MAEERKIAGTSETYSGMVVKLGEFEYTTVGGGIEGDRQQLEPVDTTTLDETLPPVIDTEGDTNDITDNTNDFVYLEDYDIGTNDGILNTVDAVYWNNLGRTDIASIVQQFIISGNYPPNRPTQGGGGMSENTGNNPGGNVGGNGNQGGGGGMY